jgi:hypothetical protein
MSREAIGTGEPFAVGHARFHAEASARVALPRVARARSHAAASARVALPSIAVLCTAPRGAGVTAAIALALARACARPFALAAAVGEAATASGVPLPSAARAAAQLRRGSVPASARGRLVWVADERAADPVAIPDTGAPGVAEAFDTVGATAALTHPVPGTADAAAALTHPAPGAADAAAALSAELAEAAAAVAAPCALAIPFARSDALDRVLGEYDAVVVVRALDASVALLQAVLASVGALERPVVSVPVPGRLAAAVAATGMHVPAFATAAVAQLGIGERSG